MIERMGSMKTLYLDLASHEGLIACVTDEQILVSMSIDHRIDDAELITQVEDLLSRIKWEYQNFTHIACVIGPGGFMSLRVAVAFANALAHGLGIPCAGLHLNDVYRFRVAGFGLRDVLWLHSTKKSELFIRMSGEPELITTEKLKKFLKKNGQWTGELIPEHRKLIDEAGMKEAEAKPLAEILPEFLKALTYEKKLLKPWYGRGW